MSKAHGKGFGVKTGRRSVLRRRGRRLLCSACAAMLFSVFMSPAVFAAENSRVDAPEPLWGANLLGDMGGLRTLLGKYGITFALTETSEALGNPTGGVRRGVDYEGATEMGLALDTQKAFGWRGGTFFVSALQLHGRGLTEDNLYNLHVVSGIEAERTTRLWELWFDQVFAGDRADVKIGQIGIDEEFIVSQCCSVYLNAMMGWPVLPAADLYAGGPAFPLASPAIRFRVQPDKSITLLAGVFDDNPPGGSFYDDSQLRDAEASGTRFNFTTGALFIGEIQYALNQPSGRCGRRSAAGLPGVYKLGAWFDTAKFPDQRFDASGLSLANPAGSGIARLHRNDFSIYAIADQTLLRGAGGRSVSGFARLMGAPSDRNLVDFSMNAGLNVAGLLPGRSEDVFGIGYGLAHVSGRAADLDRDEGFYCGAHCPVRGSEQFIELTYQFQVTPWEIIQPDLQYIIDPGGGLADPLHPASRIDDELVLGLRVIINF